MFNNIKICTPFYDMIDERVEQGIYDLLDSKELNCAWLSKQGTAIADTRNFLINENNSDLEYQKLKDDYTHYLFIDSDVIVKEKDIKKLLDYNVDIISGVYKSRESEFSYVGGLFKKDENGSIVDVLKMKTDSEGLMEVDWVGGGCLLIKKEVFECLPYPWFHYPIIEKIKDGNKHRKLIFEDVGLCMLAKQHNFKIWLDCDTIVTHLARNYDETNSSDLELLFKNVNHDVNKMFQLIRKMSYRLSVLEKEKSN